MTTWKDNVQFEDLNPEHKNSRDFSVKTFQKLFKVVLCFQATPALQPLVKPRTDYVMI
jgi:hypothetical protein